MPVVASRVGKSMNKSANRRGESEPSRRYEWSYEYGVLASINGKPRGKHEIVSSFLLLVLLLVLLVLLNLVYSKY